MVYIVEDHSVVLNMGDTRIEHIDFENTAEKWSSVKVRLTSLKQARGCLVEDVFKIQLRRFYFSFE